MANQCHNGTGMPAASFSPQSRFIRVDDPEKHMEDLSYTVEALIATARLALDNETSSSELRDRAAAVAEETLSVAQALMGIVGEGIELTMHRRKGGVA
jgi:uncharacterized protein YlxW (UPF0749 family)